MNKVSNRDEYWRAAGQADSSEILRYANVKLEAPESEEVQLEAAQKAHAPL